MDSVRSLIGLEEEESSEFLERGGLDVEGLCPSLSYKQRIWGFIICLGLGFLLGFLSSFMLIFSITSFAVLYTLANIVSLCSTGFLVGPWKQIKNMFEKTRIIATIVYLSTLALTLFVAFYIPDTKKTLRTGLIIILLILQWLALIWYTLSYIPFARSAVKGCLSGLFRNCSF